QGEGDAVLDGDVVAQEPNPARLEAERHLRGRLEGAGEPRADRGPPLGDPALLVEDARVVGEQRGDGVGVAAVVRLDEPRAQGAPPRLVPAPRPAGGPPPGPGPGPGARAGRPR